MIADFYKDADIFFTGGSGVVGKAAIEKLLRSCNVRHIFILLRSKKGRSTEERLEDIKMSRIFNVLRECKPNELDKLVAIPGNVELDGLGISLEDRELLRNVSIFFNSAATIRFDEPIRMAFLMNIKSTLEALKFAETLKNLKIFTHVSTVFSNPHLKHVEDKIQPAVFDWRTAIKLLELKYDEVSIEPITQKLITNFPNTYTFTKHLAEHVVNDFRFKVPVTIFRPSAVIGALEEPEPGFSETMVGVMGVITFLGLGLNKVMPGNGNVRIDITHLDIGTKLLLIHTARAGQIGREKLKEATPVSMCSSAKYFPFTCEQMSKSMSQAALDFPFEKAFMIPGMTFSNCSFTYRLMNLFLHLIPAFVMDSMLRLFGKKPFMMATQRRIFSRAETLTFFLKNQYTSNGITNFGEILKSEERTDFDIRCVSPSYRNGTNEDLMHMMNIFVRGCRKFLANEDDSSLPKARQMLKVKIFMYNIVRLCLLYVVGCVIYRRVTHYIVGCK